MEAGFRVPKAFWLAVWLAAACLWPAAGPAAGEQDGPQPENLVLARVEAPSGWSSLGLPVHDQLRDTEGSTYALVLATLEVLQASGRAHLDLDAAPSGTGYLVGVPGPGGGPRGDPAGLSILYDDGFNLITRDGPGAAESLIAAGYAPRLLSPNPLVVPPRAARAAFPHPSGPRPLVSALLAGLDPAVMTSHISGLSGEAPVTVDGASYTFTTRKTTSGEPIEKATQYVHERLTALGIAATYHPWISSSYSGRNVISELPGQTLPGRIILLTAHLDSISSSLSAPGADDNASGSAALLTAAAVMRNYSFSRTIRFAFFTGEEQGLRGSLAYAQMLQAGGQEVEAVLNMDMIAYSTQAEPVFRLYTRTSTWAGYLDDQALAALLTEVVGWYGLGSALDPVTDGYNSGVSDHYSFWTTGVPAVMVIEDDQDNFNPRYHTAEDRVIYLNQGFGGAVMKAVTGTAAILAGIADPSPLVPLWLLLARVEDRDKGSGWSVVQHPADDG